MKAIHVNPLRLVVREGWYRDMNGDTPDAAGNETFDDAFDRLFHIAYRSAYRLLGSREDSEDVAIEVLARTALRWQKLLPEPDPWVTTVSVNLSIDLWRRRKRAPSHERVVEDRPSQEFDERRIDLVRVLGRLPRRQRDAVVLRFFADLTAAQTAVVLGVSIGTVKQHTARALARLRRDLEEPPVRESKD
jgi:RNA polymerase sigma factor (sigma-70 family)